MISIYARFSEYVYNNRVRLSKAERPGNSFILLELQLNSALFLDHAIDRHGAQVNERARVCVTDAITRFRMQARA